MMPLLAQASAGEGLSYWPLGVLVISVAFIVVAISVLRLHAFLALLLATLLAGWLTTPGRLPREVTATELSVFEIISSQAPCTLEAIQEGLGARGFPKDAAALQVTRLLAKELIWEDKFHGRSAYRARTTVAEATKMRGANHFVAALDQAARDFGTAAGNIGVVIALASIIGICLMESGAADKIVRRFMGLFGERRAALALLASGFFLSIPVFFDTVFFLLIPIARALAVRTGKHYTLYVMAMCGGGAITHSMVPPTPGPLLVADALKLDLGLAIVAGLATGILPAVVVYHVARWMDRAYATPLRETAGASMADLRAIVSRRDEDLPGFGWSVLPIVLPAGLIALASFLDLAGKRFPWLVSWLGGAEGFATVNATAQFFGNKTMALLLGAGIAMGIYLRQYRLTLAGLGEKLGPALETAGVIILITSAGGAFGAMIRHSGVGEVIKDLAVGREINYVLLAWAVTAVIRIAQGSATVAMITGSALMHAIIGDGAGLPYHLAYIYLAVGFGSIILSWMNDSGFWVVAKLGGFTERETLKSWTVMLTVISVTGLIETWLLASALPLR